MNDIDDEIPAWDSQIDYGTPESVMIFDSEFHDTVIEVGNNYGSTHQYDQDEAGVYLNIRDERGNDAALGLTNNDARALITAIQAVIDYHTPDIDE